MDMVCKTCGEEVEPQDVNLDFWICPTHGTIHVNQCCEWAAWHGPVLIEWHGEKRLAVKNPYWKDDDE